MSSIYSEALLQDLATELTRIISHSPLNVARLVPLSPSEQTAYETMLTTYLEIAIQTFVQLHPNVHTNNTPPQQVLNILLFDLLSRGTISNKQCSQIVAKLLFTQQQNMAAFAQFQAMSTMFNNSNQPRFQQPVQHLSPNYPQLLSASSVYTPNAPINVVPRSEATVHPPFDIIDTQTSQPTILSQLSVPNSHSSSPNARQVNPRRLRYDSIDDLLPPVPGPDHRLAKSVVELVFGASCPNRTSSTSPAFKSRSGHMPNQRNWKCNCQLVVQTRLLPPRPPPRHNEPPLIGFYLPRGQDLPHQGAPAEPAVQPSTFLTVARAVRLRQDNDFHDDNANTDQLNQGQKDVINSILETMPTIQPLKCWSVLRSIIPEDETFAFEFGGMGGYYLLVDYMKKLRRSARPNVGFGYRILDFSSLLSFIHQNSILEYLVQINYTAPRSIHDFRTFTQLKHALDLSDPNRIFTVPITDEFVTSLGVNENESNRARSHILLMNAGSFWSILLFLKQPEHQRILTMDFSTGFLADNASVGQVCALQLLVDNYDRSKLRQRAHPLAYSVTYETKAQVRVAHHLIGVVAAKLFLEPMTVARQIADRSQAIISGTALSHPNSVVYPCMIHYRLSTHNSPIWRKHIHNFKSFEVYLHVFITRMTTVFRTDVVRKKALVHFTADCNHEDIDEGDFCEFFHRNYGAGKPLFDLLSMFSIHMTGYKMDNQAHESGYRKQKGSSRLGVPPIGPLNQSVSGFLSNTVRELMGHDLARVSSVTSFQMDPSVRVGQGYTIPQSILCEVALADPGRDVRAISHQVLHDLCPEICGPWFRDLGVDLRSPLTLCWVVNGLPTFGRDISDVRIIRFLRYHFEETYDPFPFNKFYAHLSYDLFIVFQAKPDLNPRLMSQKAVDLFGLFCWKCHYFQTKGLCPCCLLVQEFRGDLSPSLTTYLSVVYANRPGTSRVRVNPQYARTRTGVVNRVYHDQFGLPTSTPLVPLEYLANRSREVLDNLWRRMFKSRPDFYHASTAGSSKAFLLTDLVAGSSLGIRIVDLVRTFGNTASPFIERHETLRANPFPSTSREPLAEYAHYPYPPIRDPHSRSSCIGYYSGCFIATLADINLEFNLPIALALEYLVDGRIIAEDELVGVLPHLRTAVSEEFGTHLIPRVPMVKRAIFTPNQQQELQEDVDTHQLNFVLSQNLGASLHLNPALTAFAENTELENKRVSFVFRVCKKHYPIFRIKGTRIWEYHLFSLESVQNEQENCGVRMLCEDVRALFRLLHRISVYENWALDANTRLSYQSKRSTIFRFSVQPTIQSTFEIAARWIDRIGTEITAPSLAIPDEEEDEHGEEVAEVGEEEEEEEVGEEVEVVAVDPQNMVAEIEEQEFDALQNSDVSANVNVSDNDLEMPEAGQAHLLHVGSINNNRLVVNNSVSRRTVPNGSLLASDVSEPNDSVSSRDIVEPNAIAPIISGQNLPSMESNDSSTGDTETNDARNLPVDRETEVPVEGWIGPREIEYAQILRQYAVDRNERNVQEQIRLDQEIREELMNEREGNGNETSNRDEETLPLPLPAPIVRAPSEPYWVDRAPIQPVPVIVGHILPPPVPQPQEDDIPQMPRWPISLHVPNLSGLDLSNLMPWNQLSTRYTAAANQFRRCAGPSQEPVFTYLNRLYDSPTFDRSGLPWLLDTAPPPPDVVANVEQNIYSMLVEKDLRSLQGDEWLNDNVINFVLNRLVHFQASRPCTGKLTYLYDTRFYPAYLSRDPMIISRISQQTRAPLRPFTESQRRGGGLFYQNENIFDPATYKFVFLPHHAGQTHWQFVLLVPGLRRIYFGEPFGVMSNSGLLNRGSIGRILDRVEKWIDKYEQHHGRRVGASRPWTRHSFFPSKVQFDSCSCGLFLLLVPFLLIQLSILRPSCDEQQSVEYVRNFILGMQMGNSPNARKMRNWVMFVIATNQIVPNGKQVATRSIPSLGQPILVEDGPIDLDNCVLCQEELSADNEENPLVINLNRNCIHKLHLECAQRYIQNNKQTPRFGGDVFNTHLHPLAACLICMRGGGWAYATTHQLLENNFFGWRRELMIRVPRASVGWSATSQVREASSTWSHQYLSFRENGRESHQASVNYGERTEEFTLNASMGYTETSTDWLPVTEREEWNRFCIAAKRPDYICLPTGNYLI